MESGNDLLSRLVSKQVPSALKGLTSVFGMGTGGSLSPSSPEFSQGFVLPPSSQGLRTHRAFFFSRVPSKPHIQIFSILSNLLFCPLVSFSLLPLDQVLDRLVSPSSMRCRTSTGDLSPGSLPGVLLLSNGTLLLEVGFTLRCLQRLSLPHFASQLCRWHDNCCTRDASTPVLSY